MNFLYDAGIRLYDVGARVAALRSPKARKFVEGRSASVDALEKLTLQHSPDGYDYWFHAASLGEFEQARPLIEGIRRENPEAKILLTFFSPSGYEVRKNYPEATTVVYLPSDTKKNVRRFLDVARPGCAVFVKYEFWLNFLGELERRVIPTFLVSAIFRPAQIFFRPWGNLFRKGLAAYKTVFVQNEESERLLKGIGVKDVRITGDTRFDRVYDIMKAEKNYPAVEKWKHDRFTLVVGSSWPQDEERYLNWINENPDIRVIIAPHEFDGDRIAALRRRLNRPSTTWTEIDVNDPDAIGEDVQTLIVDAFGHLSSLYRYADIVIVGGGFGAGIHNVNEAAVYGVPVIFGPNHRKFKEAVDLIAAGGAFCYETSKDIEKVLSEFRTLADKRREAGIAAGNYIKNNLGATELILNELIKTKQKRT